MPDAGLCADLLPETISPSNSWFPTCGARFGMTPVFLDPHLQCAFEQDGFAVTRLLSPERAAETLATVLKVRDGKPFEPDTPDHAVPYHVSLMDPDPDYRKAARAFAEATLTEPLGRILSGYRFLTGGFLVKAPGAAEVCVHRDWTMTGRLQEVALNCWCALVDTDAVNGGLALVPGSHALVGNIEGPGVPSFFAGYAETLKAYSVAVELKAGEAVIFDYRALHWSNANRSTDLRVALSAGLVSLDTRPVLYLPDTADRRQFRVIEPADPDWTDTIVDRISPGPMAGRTLGHVRNRNSVVTQRQFLRLLAKRQASFHSSRGLPGRIMAWVTRPRNLARPQ